MIGGVVCSQQSADDELRMTNMKADLDRANDELQSKTAELDNLTEELNSLRHDNEVCIKQTINGLLSRSMTNPNFVGIC